MKYIIFPLFLLFICHTFRQGTSEKGSSRGKYKKQETIKRGPRKGEHGKGEPGKGEPCKSGPDKGESSDDEPGPSKKPKICDIEQGIY